MTTNSQKPSFFIIGAGRAGASLAFYFIRRGYRVLSLAERNPERLAFLENEFGWSMLRNSVDYRLLDEANIIMLTMQDNQIPEAAHEIAGNGNHWRGKLVVHTSGALPSEVLSPFRERGAHIGSVHPVYSFALDPRENHKLKELWFNLEGDDPALQVFESIFEHTENEVFRVTVEQKKAIHIASVIYANFYVALAQMSQAVLKNILKSGQDTFRLLNPLLVSSTEQVLEHGPAAALTGPVKRGDTATIKSHLEYLEQHHPELLTPYRLLTKALLPLSGLLNKDKREIENLLNFAQEQSE